VRFEILLFAFIFLGVSPCTGDQNVLFCALTARNSDKPGLAKKTNSRSTKSYFRMPLVKSAWQAHCKNRKYQIVKRMPSMTTSVTCYTDCVRTRFLQAKKPPSPSLWRASRGRIEPSRGCGGTLVRPRQSPARPKHRYNAKSTIYARFCVFLVPRPRCKQPRPNTSVAGTAMPDSGHDRAQRGQNPGRTQNRAVARFWRHIFAWIVKSANSTSLPCLILLQIVQMPAIQY